MARSQIGSIVKVSVYRFYSSAHHALFPRNHLSKGLPYIQVYSLSSFPGLFGHGPTDILRRARKDVGGSLRLPVLYWNNYVCSYTTSSKSKRSGPDKNPRLLEIGTTSSERTFRLSIVPLALLAFVGVGLLLHYNDERRSIPKASQQGSIRNMQNAISKPSIGGPFELINYEGKVVTDREFVGYWTLIYFGYTSSPDVGPEEVRKMARAIDILAQDSSYGGVVWKCSTACIESSNSLSMPLGIDQSSVPLLPVPFLPLPPVVLKDFMIQTERPSVHHEISGPYHVCL